MCPSVCRRVLYTAWYSISESTDVIYYVYEIFAMLLVCISTLVGTCVVCSESDVVVYCVHCSSESFYALFFVFYGLST